MTTPMLQRTKTLQEAIVGSRRHWKLGRVLGRKHEIGEPFDIMIEPILGGITATRINHSSENATAVFLCAHDKKEIPNIMAEFAKVGSDFTSKSPDGLRHVWVTPKTADAVKQIEDLITKLEGVRSIFERDIVINGDSQ